MILDQLWFTTALPTLNAFYVVTRAASTAARSHPHHPQDTNIVEVKAKAGVRPVAFSPSGERLAAVGKTTIVDKVLDHP